MQKAQNLDTKALLNTTHQSVSITSAEVKFAGVVPRFAQRLPS